MINYVTTALFSFFLSVIIAIACIPILKKVKAGQTILSYVKEHESKNGTPTMGGFIFVIAIIISFFLLGKVSGIAIVSISITTAFALVGFLDDLIKVKSRENEGLKPLQKIIFQTVIGLLAGFFAIKNCLTYFYLPFVNKTIDLGIFAMPIIAILFLAVTNSVNLTDGLDGLASSVSIVYLFSFAILLILQMNYFEFYPLKQEIPSILRLCFASVGALLGFLIFNTNKASVFMGDTGSLALGGLIGSVTIFTGNTLFLPFLGFTFVLSSISVIIQVFVYKRTKKRVFLMAPFHHHLQHKGLSEGKVAYLYSLITLLISVFVMLFYL